MAARRRHRPNEGSNRVGLETTRALRAELLEVRALAVSGGVSGVFEPSDYLRHAAVFGADGTLLKPFNNGDLRQAVTLALGGPRCAVGLSRLPAGAPLPETTGRFHV